MEQQYIPYLTEAYQRGYAMRYKGQPDAPEMKMHYFKAKEDLPRVQRVLGFLQGIVAMGQCESLLDIGSGRGVFLFPLLRDFPQMEVTSIDLFLHRVELLQCIHDGGVANLHPLQADICIWDAQGGKLVFDVQKMVNNCTIEHFDIEGADEDKKREYMDNFQSRKEELEKELCKNQNIFGILEDTQFNIESVTKEEFHIEESRYPFVRTK